MKKIPIVFSFNDGYLMPAGVCITSLLINAKKDVFYDIFILHSSQRLSQLSKEKLVSLKKEFSNCNFTFVDVKDAFKDAFEIRNITIDAYYRLLIPFVIKGYDKIIYSDVDVVFDTDISDLLDFVKDKKIAAIDASEHYSSKYKQYIGLKGQKYYNSGLLVFNVKEITDNVEEMNVLIKRKFTYQDQDIINILYEGEITNIPIEYNLTFLKRTDLKNTNKKIKGYHYSGKKPWNAIVPFNDYWWGYYRKSVFYERNFYMDFMKNKYEDFAMSLKLIEMMKKYYLFDIYGKIKAIRKWFKIKEM